MDFSKIKVGKLYEVRSYQSSMFRCWYVDVIDDLEEGRPIALRKDEHPIVLVVDVPATNGGNIKVFFKNKIHFMYYEYILRQVGK